MMRSCQYSEVEIPYAHAGGNEVLKHCKQSTKTKTRNRMNRLRQLTVQVSVRKYMVNLTENLVRGTTRPKLDSRSLGRCPWLQCPRSGQVVPQNKRPTPRKKTQKSSSAETARLVLIPPETGRTKRQLSGDCSTSFWSPNPKERRRTRRAWSCSQ